MERGIYYNNIQKRRKMQVRELWKYQFTIKNKFREIENKLVMRRNVSRQENLALTYYINKTIIMRKEKGQK